jgi:hypothetical protein
MFNTFTKRLTRHFRAHPSRSRGSMMKTEARDAPEEHHQCVGLRTIDYYIVSQPAKHF